MEEEKVAKKNNKPMIIIAVAALLIVAGVALILTGNNKSFLTDSKEGNSGKNEEADKPAEPDNTNQEGDNDPTRGMTPEVLTDLEVLQLIYDKKSNEFSDQTWNLGVVHIIGHDEKNEKFLVSYEEIAEDGTSTYKQTIVSVLNGTKNVELPGWVEGERDLTVYNFVMNDDTAEPVTIDEPNIDEPTRPSDDGTVELPYVPADQLTDQPNTSDQVVLDDDGIDPIAPNEAVIEAELNE